MGKVRPWPEDKKNNKKMISWRTRPGDNLGFSKMATITMHDEVGPYLEELAASFPAAFVRALRHASWTLRDDIRQAIEAGSTPKGRLNPVSRMHMYRRMELLKMGMGTDEGWKNGARFQLKKKLGYRTARGKERLMDRWRGDTRKGNIRSSYPMNGKIKRVIKTVAKDGGRTFIIGAQTPVARRWFEAVQSGRRGSKGVFQFLGQQPITPAMRRAFWAAGIPLKKGKTTIEQTERSVVTPVYQVFAQKFPEVMRKRIENILAGKTPGGAPK